MDHSCPSYVPLPRLRLAVHPAFAPRRAPSAGGSLVAPLPGVRDARQRRRIARLALTAVLALLALVAAFLLFGYFTRPAPPVDAVLHGVTLDAEMVEVGIEGCHGLVGRFGLDGQEGIAEVDLFTRHKRQGFQ